MLISFRPMYTFRERAPEWVLSVGLLLWGLLLSWHPEVFQTEAYGLMLSIASPRAWVVWSTSIGLFRLICLSINGAWRPTPHLRALGSIGGLTLWSTLVLMSVDNMDVRAGGVAIYGMLLAFELMALWWAAGDAKVVDTMIATKRLKVPSNGN